MKSLMVCLVGGLMALASTAHAADHYYVAHMGAETCVPLDDLSRDFSRSYYGTGDLHTLTDFEAAIRAHGITLTRMNGDVPGITSYRATTTEGAGFATMFVLFNDQAACEAAMARLPR